MAAIHNLNVKSLFKLALSVTLGAEKTRAEGFWVEHRAGCSRRPARSPLYVVERESDDVTGRTLS